MGLSFRPVARSDFDLLARWLADPLVRRWWNHEYTVEALERDFGATIDGNEPGDLDLALLADGSDGMARPVGLIQSYLLHDFPTYVEELSTVMEIRPGDGSIDYLVGEPDCRGRGVGRAMIAAYIDRVWLRFPALTQLVVPVSAANVASWKALAGAGFHKLGEGDLEPDNPIDDPRHIIMGIDRPIHHHGYRAADQSEVKR